MRQRAALHFLSLMQNTSRVFIIHLDVFCELLSPNCSKYNSLDLAGWTDFGFFPGF